MEKLTATSLPINSALLIVKPIVKPRAEVSSIKQKKNKHTKANGLNKHVKEILTFDFYLIFAFILIVGKSSIFSHVFAV